MPVSLEQRRIARGLSNRELARLTDIKRDRLRRHLLNPDLMTFGEAKQCCRVLGIRSLCEVVTLEAPANDPIQKEIT